MGLETPLKVTSTGSLLDREVMLVVIDTPLLVAGAGASATGEPAGAFAGDSDDDRGVVRVL